ncbi:MAG TPA: aryl-sulfate sulfotransferase, partial [Candidatus Dormibacteraeota bacterium]|nr:aryl-sulfate sulfotransferase [Candidatus Dormibacteraeota bacterium]
MHTWEAPYPPGMYGYLSDRGTLVYNGRTTEARNDFIGQSPWKGGALVEMDWNGEVLLEVRHPDHHHDGRLLRNGNVALLCMTAIPRGLAARVVGGLPQTEHEGEMYADYVVEMTPAGEVVWEWFSWEHIDPETDFIDYAAEHRAEWTHGNTIAELSNGDLMVSFRNISTVAIIDRRSGQVSWKVGPPLLAQQHAPVELQSGNLLIFDNGTHRSNHPVPFSRVIELNRASKEIVWSYQERLVFNFFSPFISNAERLFNGNTLICEGN